jgi:hypothetical protein
MRGWQVRRLVPCRSSVVWRGRLRPREAGGGLSLEDLMANSISRARAPAPH